MTRQITTFVSLSVLLLLGVSFWLWSFTQTDPNLYYSSTSVWVSFQQSLWHIPRVTVVWWFGINILLSFFCYFYALRTKLSFLPMLLVPCFILLTSNNALSHDIYNYMFNAKALAVYHQDPHLLSALEIAPKDDWVRFMHNVHTTAPYGRFWTYFSLIPFYLGLGKFLTTYVAFKVFMALGFGILVYLQHSMLEDKKKTYLFLLNPLVFIETLLNGHNDVWMMAMALGSLSLLVQTKKLMSWRMVTSLALLLLSTQIKVATFLLLPLWILLLTWRVVKKENDSSTSWITRMLRMTERYWAEIASVLMFLPLVTERSQQFNPWYLIWPLTFLPFFRSRFMQLLLITFSITSMLRYIPFLFAGEYTDTLQFQMRVITWSAILVASALWLVTRERKSK